MPAKSMPVPNHASLESLVLRIYKETKVAWSKYSNDNDYIKNHGFWVMVGPPKARPPVFIVSSNPGAQH